MDDMKEFYAQSCNLIDTLKKRYPVVINNTPMFVYRLSATGLVYFEKIARSNIGYKVQEGKPMWRIVTYSLNKKGEIKFFAESYASEERKNNWISEHKQSAQEQEK